MSAFAAHEEDDLDYSYTSPDPATTTPPMPQEMNSDPDTHSRSRSANPLLGNDNPLVSELEQEVLDEYSRLLRNVNQVSCSLYRARRAHQCFLLPEIWIRSLDFSERSPATYKSFAISHLSCSHQLEYP